MPYDNTLRAKRDSVTCGPCGPDVHSIELGVRGLTAEYVLEFTYKRSLGRVIGEFFAGLREGRLSGVRTASGRVIVPPTEYDPDTGDSIVEHVSLDDTGSVTTWAWVEHPLPRHPLQHPFAWALIRIDGADTAMLHAVDCGDRALMHTGMRVSARWRSERRGELLDIECFVPEATR